MLSISDILSNEQSFMQHKGLNQDIPQATHKYSAQLHEKEREIICELLMTQQ